MMEARAIEVVFNPGEPTETTGLRGVSFAAAAGEFITVVGSNGSGKSTLLGVLAGDIQPAKGTVFLAGEDATQLPAHRRAKQIARIFQDPLAGTCAGLTVEENMALACSRGKKRGWRLAAGKNRREMFRARLAELRLGLEDRMDELAGRLSGGQRQAASLAMATLAESKVLLLDEHTAALDPRMAAFVLDLTRRICADYNLAALMVTHSMKAALSCGSRTLMLHRGKIVLDIKGEERANLQAADLLRLFSEKSGGEESDRMLLD